MNWTISKKLWTVAGIPLLGLVSVTAVGFWTNSLVAQNSAETRAQTERLLLLQKMKNVEFSLSLAGMEILTDRDSGTVAPALRQELETNGRALRQGLKKAAALTRTAEERQRLAAVQEDAESFIRLSTRSLPALIAQHAAPKTLAGLDDDLDAAGERITAGLEQVIDDLTSSELAAAEHLEQQVQKGNWTTGLVLALVLGLMLPILLGMVRSIALPLRRTLRMIQNLEHGHLADRLQLPQQDEIGQMGRAMDRFADSLERDVVGNLQRLARGDLTLAVRPRDAEDRLRGALHQLGGDLSGLMSRILTSGDRIATGASQVADASQSLSQGATEQASSLEEISASLQELTSQVSQNAENAGQANSHSSGAQSAAEKGTAQMAEMVAAMDQINAAAQDISKIIKVIDEIAFQTNLLALNAAVEAARAGQHGKGFSVVAEEVRNLAARSAKAARETAELIEGAVAMTKQGGQVANQTATAFTEIVTGITQVSELVAGIAAASSEQAQGIAQINQGLGQIDQVTQQNTANAEQSAAAAEELSGQASTMNGLLARFTLKDPSRAALPAGQPPAPLAHGEAGTSRDVLQWKTSYATGIQIVDRQHRRLLDLINELFQAMKSGGDRATVEHTVDGLIDYTRSHFMTEEQLMQEHGYPDYADHKHTHDAFVNEVAGYRQKIKDGARLTAADVFNFLKGWLINHIEKADRDGYAPFLRERGVR